MDKRQQRTQRKIDTIKQTALDLFSTYGVDKVNMDEIAEKANVSKVTIYKYFGSKEALYAEVIQLFVEQSFAATEDILNSDIDFLEKFKLVLQIKQTPIQIASMERLFEVWEEDGQTGDLSQTIQSRTRAIMYKFYEEGIEQGHINKEMPFETLYLYSEVFRHGMRAMLSADERIFDDQDLLNQLYDVYFFGFINKK